MNLFEDMFDDMVDKAQQLEQYVSETGQEHLKKTFPS